MIHKRGSLGIISRGSFFVAYVIIAFYMLACCLPGAFLPTRSLPGAFLPTRSLPGAFLPMCCLPGAFLPMCCLPGAFLPMCSLPGAFLPTRCIEHTIRQNRTSKATKSDKIGHAYGIPCISPTIYIYKAVLANMRGIF